jgi:ribosomal subunit interface protein
VQITLSVQHSDMPLGLDDAVAATIGRLDRFDPRLDHADVHLSVEHNPRIAERVGCEVVLTGGGEHVVAQAAGADVPSAVGRTVLKLEHQLDQLRTERERRRRRGVSPSA